MRTKQTKSNKNGLVIFRYMAIFIAIGLVLVMSGCGRDEDTGDDAHEDIVATLNITVDEFLVAFDNAASMVGGFNYEITERERDTPSNHLRSFHIHVEDLQSGGEFIVNLPLNTKPYTDLLASIGVWGGGVADDWMARGQVDLAVIIAVTSMDVDSAASLLISLMTEDLEEDYTTQTVSNENGIFEFTMSVGLVLQIRPGDINSHNIIQLTPPPEDEVYQPTEQQDYAETIDFGITRDEFEVIVTRNLVALLTDFALSNETREATDYGYTYFLNPHNAIQAWISPSTNFVSSIMYLGSVDGTPQSLLNVPIVKTALISAFGTPIEEAIIITRDMTSEAASDGTSYRIINNVRFSLSIAPLSMMVISPLEGFDTIVDISNVMPSDTMSIPYDVLDSEWSCGTLRPSSEALINFVSHNIVERFPDFFDNFSISISPSSSNRMPEIRVAVSVHEEIAGYYIYRTRPNYAAFHHENVMRLVGEFLISNGFNAANILIYGPFREMDTVGYGYYTAGGSFDWIVEEDISLPQAADQWIDLGIILIPSTWDASIDPDDTWYINAEGIGGAFLMTAQRVSNEFIDYLWDNSDTSFQISFNDGEGGNEFQFSNATVWVNGNVALFLWHEEDTSIMGDNWTIINDVMRTLSPLR